MLSCQELKKRTDVTDVYMQNMRARRLKPPMLNVGILQISMTVFLTYWQTTHRILTGKCIFYFTVCLTGSFFPLLLVSMPGNANWQAAGFILNRQTCGMIYSSILATESGKCIEVFWNTDERSRKHKNTLLMVCPKVKVKSYTMLSWLDIWAWFFILK